PATHAISTLSLHDALPILPGSRFLHTEQQHMRYDSVFKPDLFAGQTVMVTGGGSGIGRCTAHELASLGAHVVLVGRKPEKLEKTDRKSTRLNSSHVKISYA